jgi:hypothetical protein
MDQRLSTRPSNDMTCFAYGIWQEKGRDSSVQQK